MTYVHYKGVAQSSLELVSGRTHIAGGTHFYALANIKSGKLRVIAMLGEQRSRMLSDMLAAIEQGIDVVYPSWLGVLAPAGTPGAILNLLTTEFVNAARSPDVVKQLESRSSRAIGSTPEVFRKRYTSELARWKKIIRQDEYQAGGLRGWGVFRY